MHELN